MKLHSSLTIDKGEARQRSAVTEFLDWWEGVLAKPDKFRLFCQLLRFPVPTVSLTGELFAMLEKVYDGRNPVLHYDFASPEFEQDWQEYREQKKLPEFWRMDAFEMLKEGCVNSLLVVDLPAEQTGESPEPYTYFLDVCKIHDYGWDGEGFDWVCWKTADDRLAWFDKTHYRTFQTKKDTADITGVISEVPHGLGFTPVFWFWNESQEVCRTDVKESPLSKYLGDLDWLLAFSVSKRVLELYASYPIYWGYESSCEYVLEADGYEVERCHHGAIRDANGSYVLDARTRGVKACPICADRRLAGPGTFIDVPTPNPDMGTPDMANPVGVVPAERSSLDYNQEEEQRLRSKLFRGITGRDKDPVNGQAINEQQVGELVEGQSQRLKNLAKNLEAAQKNAETTICLLRYGANVFRGMTVSLGREFHLFSADDLLRSYEEARSKGIDASTLDRMQEDYIAARYRFDPIRQERERILVNLDPFRHKTGTEVENLYSRGLCTPENYFLKFNFSTLIGRFEREQASLVQFASALTFERKIERITEILISYATESINAANARNGQGANTTAQRAEAA